MPRPCRHTTSARPGERYQLSQPWERDDLAASAVTLLSQCDTQIKERMVWHLLLREDELGLRVGGGIGIGVDDVKHLRPLQSQTLTEEQLERLRNLGHNGPGEGTDHQMTHCVPNERDVVVTDEADCRDRRLTREAGCFRE